MLTSENFGLVPVVSSLKTDKIGFHALFFSVFNEVTDTKVPAIKLLGYLKMTQPELLFTTLILHCLTIKFKTCCCLPEWLTA